MKNEYMYIGITAAFLTSVGSAVYAYVSGKKAKELNVTLDRRVDDALLSVEKTGEMVTKKTEETVSDLNKRLDKKVDGIADSLDVDIPDAIVEEALKKAAERAATSAINKTSKDILDEYSVSVRSEVRKSVDLAYANTKIDVKNELTRQMSNIDISGIKREIIEDAKRKVEEELEEAMEKITDAFEEELDDAKEKASEKFDKELDSISTRFSNDLERGSKIYKTLSDKLGTV